MPWRNGGGETLEVAVSPTGAGLDTFDWRVSMAVVAIDGPFSVFRETDRTLVLLGGNGMTLDIAGRRPVLLTRDSAPCVFPGDVATRATLTDGAVTDLNVMTARGRYTHAVERFAATREVQAGPRETLLLLGEGATVTAGTASMIVGPLDVVSLESGETARIRPAMDAGYLLATIRPIG